MSSDARETLLAVTGTRTRAADQDDDPALDALWGWRRRSYRVVLEDASDTRWVQVEVVELIGERKRSVTVRLADSYRAVISPPRARSDTSPGRD